MDTEENEPLSYGFILGQVLAVTAAVFGHPVRSSDNFFDLGGDSVAAVELLAKLEATLGAEPDADDLISASDLAAFALTLTA
jgi:acyl carrier protein